MSRWFRLYEEILDDPNPSGAIRLYESLGMLRIPN